MINNFSTKISWSRYLISSLIKVLSIFYYTLKIKIGFPHFLNNIHKNAYTIPVFFTYYFFPILLDFNTNNIMFLFIRISTYITWVVFFIMQLFKLYFQSRNLDLKSVLLHLNILNTFSFMWFLYLMYSQLKSNEFDKITFSYDKSNHISYFYKKFFV